LGLGRRGSQPARRPKYFAERGHAVVNYTARGPPGRARRGRIWSIRCFRTGASSTRGSRRPGRASTPGGIEIRSYVAGLYALGKSSGYYCGDAPASSPCTNPDADLNGDFALVNAGEPYSDEAKARLAEIYAHHQAYGIPGAPAPLLIENGWTDDLFPPEQAILVYDRSAARSPVSLRFGDLGHSRGSNKPTVNHAFNDQAAAFFDRYLRGGSAGPARGRHRLHADVPGERA
jgi:hypothetical protein